MAIYGKRMVFFILKKKNSQVTFLHVFHHGCLPMVWWWNIRLQPGGFGVVHGFVNCCVHVVMYLYYGIAALGPKYQKYIWWKRYVTVFQLAQFLITTLHNSQFLFFDCAYPWKAVVWIQVFTSIIAILFLNFYFKTYWRSSQAPSEKHAQTEGSTLNADHTNDSPNGRWSKNTNSVRERKNIMQ